MKYALAALFLLSGCTGNFIEYQHTSAIFAGVPFNSRAEIQTDLLCAGHRHTSSAGRVYVRGAVCWQGGPSELEPQASGEPFAQIAIGYEVD